MSNPISQEVFVNHHCRVTVEYDKHGQTIIRVKARRLLVPADVGVDYVSKDEVLVWAAEPEEITPLDYGVPLKGEL